MRTHTAAAVVAAICGSAHAQVTSTWDSVFGDFDWNNPDNWDHDDPSVNTYPNNGNENKTFNVILDGLTEMSSSIEIDTLDMMGGAGIAGSIDLDVLGPSTFRSGNVGFLNSGFVKLKDVTVPGALNINDTNVSVNGTMTVGDTGNGGIVLAGTAMLDANAGAIIFLKNGNITSQNLDGPQVIAAELTKTGGNGLSTVQCRFTLEFPGGIKCFSGEIRFATPIQGATYMTELKAATIEVANGSTVRFSRTVNITGNLSVPLADDSLLDFFDGDFDLSGNTIQAFGQGRVTLSGGGASLSNGTLDCEPDAPFEFHAGRIGPGQVTNQRAFKWGGGSMEGAGAGQVVFVNNDQSNNARTFVGDIAASRIVKNGTFRNDGMFLQSRLVKLDVDGVIDNLLGATWTIEDANLLPVGDAGLFINRGKFLANGLASSLVSVCFQNMGLVECSGGTLQFTNAKDFDANTGTLTGGTWCVTGTGEMLFGAMPLQQVGAGAELQVKQNGKAGIEKITKNDGCLTAAVTTPVTFDGPLQNTGKFEIGGDPDDGTSVSISDLQNDGSLIIRDKSAVETDMLDLPEGGTVTFQVEGPIDENAPTLDTALATWNGGTVEGSGVWKTDEELMANGTIDPGIDDALGEIVFDGDIDMGGPEMYAYWRFDSTPGAMTNDLISVTGTATLGGVLEVAQIGDALSPGESRTILSAGSIVGMFAETNLPEGHSVRYTPTEVQLTVCIGDFNGDGILNILDFVAFQNAFTAGDTGADCTGDGLLNILDFVCFQNAFQSGC